MYRFRLSPFHPVSPSRFTVPPVGIGQRGARDFAAKAHVVELAIYRSQASFDITETLAKRELSEGEAKELIPTGKAAQFVVALISSDTLLKPVGRKMSD